MCKLLRENGYCDIITTKTSRDFGVDILATKNNVKYAFQCKYYSGKVGISAVQEILSGCAYYNYDVPVVLTNSNFTQSAIELANKTGVLLYSGAWINNHKVATKTSAISPSLQLGFILSLFMTIKDFSFFPFFIIILILCILNLSLTKDTKVTTKSFESYIDEEDLDGEDFDEEDLNEEAFDEEDLDEEAFDEEENYSCINSQKLPKKIGRNWYSKEEYERIYRYAVECVAFAELEDEREAMKPGHGFLPPEGNDAPISFNNIENQNL